MMRLRSCGVCVTVVRDASSVLCGGWQLAWVDGERERRREPGRGQERRVSEWGFLFLFSPEGFYQGIRDAVRKQGKRSLKYPCWDSRHDM